MPDLVGGCLYSERDLKEVNIEDIRTKNFAPGNTLNSIRKKTLTFVRHLLAKDFLWN